MADVSDAFFSIHELHRNWLHSLFVASLFYLLRHDKRMMAQCLLWVPSHLCSF